MRPFSEFNQEFSEWIRINNIPYSHKEYVKYIWEIPKKAIEQWKTELDEYRDLFSDEVYQTYINQFEPGGSILGIYNIAHDNSNTAKLYKLTSIYKEFTINDILVSKNFQLPTPPNSITLPDGISVNLPTSIEHGTLNLFSPEEKIDLVDSVLSDISKGSLVGLGFSIGQRNENILNSNSFLATINYQTGILHIIRNNNSNEEKFVKYYKWLLDEINHSNAHICSSGGASSSNSGSGGGSSKSFFPVHSSSQVTPYSYMTVSGSFNALGEPLQLVFEFDCLKQPVIEPDEEYLSLINYSSQQEVIIQQIKKSVLESVRIQQEIINNHTGNFDFQLGTTV